MPLRTRQPAQLCYAERSLCGARDVDFIFYLFGLGAILMMVDTLSRVHKALSHDVSAPASLGPAPPLVPAEQLMLRALASANFLIEASDGATELVASRDYQGARCLAIFGDSDSAYNKHSLILKLDLPELMGAHLSAPPDAPKTPAATLGEPAWRQHIGGTMRLPCVLALFTPALRDTLLSLLSVASPTNHQRVTLELAYGRLLLTWSFPKQLTTPFDPGAFLTIFATLARALSQASEATIDDRLAQQLEVTQPQDWIDACFDALHARAPDHPALNAYFCALLHRDEARGLRLLAHHPELEACDEARERFLLSLQERAGLFAQQLTSLTSPLALARAQPQQRRALGGLSELLNVMSQLPERWRDDELLPWQTLPVAQREMIGFCLLRHTMTSGRELAPLTRARLLHKLTSRYTPDDVATDALRAHPFYSDIIAALIRAYDPALIIPRLGKLTTLALDQCETLIHALNAAQQPLPLTALAEIVERQLEHDPRGELAEQSVLPALARNLLLGKVEDEQARALLEQIALSLLRYPSSEVHAQALLILAEHGSRASLGKLTLFLRRHHPNHVIQAANAAQEAVRARVGHAPIGALTAVDLDDAHGALSLSADAGELSLAATKPSADAMRAQLSACAPEPHVDAQAPSDDNPSLT